MWRRVSFCYLIKTYPLWDWSCYSLSVTAVSGIASLPSLHIGPISRVLDWFGLEGTLKIILSENTHLILCAILELLEWKIILSEGPDFLVKYSFGIKQNSPCPNLVIWGRKKNTTPSERAFKIMFLINFKRKYVVISCLPLRVQLHYSAFAFTKTPIASTSKNYELISCGWRYPIMMARLLFACFPFQFLYRTLVFMSTDGLKTVPPSNLGLLGRSHGPADSKSKGPSVK